MLDQQKVLSSVDYRGRARMQITHRWRSDRNERFRTSACPGMVLTSGKSSHLDSLHAQITGDEIAKSVRDKIGYHSN